MNNNLIPVPADSLPPEKESDANNLALQMKLWDFLGKRVSRYTMGDSSSVPSEIAQELLSSICFTLSIDLNGSPESLKWILDADLDQKLNDEIEILGKKTKFGKRLWQRACLSLSSIQNISLHDTLKSIGGFFNRYDYYYFAHSIPCDIDYQLCHPVPDRLLGIDYISEYLRRIIIENELLNCFSLVESVPLLDAYCPDYEGLLINLYEPLGINAIGLSLIGGDILSLNISDFDRKAISELLSPLSDLQSIEMLKSAASHACDTLGIKNPLARRYLRKLAETVSSRINAALGSGSLEGVFLSCLY